MVISAGIICPACFSVRALYSLQNIMMFTPCGPRAVPTGGAGLALPAGNCNRTTALIRFAIVLLKLFDGTNDTLKGMSHDHHQGWPCPLWGSLLDFLHLEEIERDRRFATKKRNHHGHFVAIHIDIADRSNKISERAIDDTNVLAFRETDLGLWLFSLFGSLLQDRIDFVIQQGDRAGARAYETGDAGRIAHNIPGFVTHDHLHQHIARKDFLLHCAPLTLLNLHLFFHRHDDAEYLVTHIHRCDTRFEVALHLILVT